MYNRESGISCPYYREERKILSAEAKRKREALGFPAQDEIVKVSCGFVNALVGGCEKKLSLIAKNNEYLCSVYGIIPIEESGKD